MNIFFYTAQKSTQASAALNWLCSLYPPLDILELPSGSGFSSHEALQLRSGDLIIFFARNQTELEALTCLKADCRNFKIFIILQEEDRKLLKIGELLNPRYYIFASEGYLHAEETIRKITKQRHKHKELSVALQLNRPAVFSCYSSGNDRTYIHHKREK